MRLTAPFPAELRVETSRNFFWKKPSHLPVLKKLVKLPFVGKFHTRMRKGMIQFQANRGSKSRRQSGMTQSLMAFEAAV